MLEAIVADRNRSRKHVERAQVILAAAEHDPVQVVASEACGRNRHTTPE